ncbi:MAG: hypothetical protein R3C11_16320 [Planctomycetaceae bacterium]
MTLLVFAGIAIDKILERQISLIDAMIALQLALCRTNLVLIVWSVNLWFKVSITLVTLFVFWRIWRRISGNEFRTRFFLKAGVILLLASCFINGVLSLKEIHSFRRTYSSSKRVCGTWWRLRINSGHQRAGFTTDHQAVLQLQWLDQPLEHCRNWNEGALTKLKAADPDAAPGS